MNLVDVIDLMAALVALALSTAEAALASRAPALAASDPMSPPEHGSKTFNSAADNGKPDKAAITPFKLASSSGFPLSAAELEVLEPCSGGDVGSEAARAGGLEAKAASAVDKAKATKAAMLAFWALCATNLVSSRRFQDVWHVVCCLLPALHRVHWFRQQHLQCL